MVKPTFNKSKYSIQDEYYTQAKDVELIVPHLNKDWKIWCPFDTEQSEFVKVLKAHNFQVCYSHIDIRGGDFFKLVNQFFDYDCIVSNPPYSIRNEILEILFEKKIKFALFISEQGIFESKRYDLFKNNKFEILVPRKRAKFNNPYGNWQTPPFKTNYYCSQVLKQQIIFE